MTRLALSALALAACSVRPECPLSYHWHPEGPDQCGYTSGTLPTQEECPTVLNFSIDDGCAATQERVCAGGAHVTQHVDPEEKFVTLTIVTQAGCVAYFEGRIL